MDQNIQPKADPRPLIESLNDYTLLGLSKLGEPHEQEIALEVLAERGVATDTVMEASSRLITACDALDALFECEDPSASLIVAKYGEGPDLLETGLGR